VRTGALTGGIRMPLDRTALLIVARVRATVRAERDADINELGIWFGAELAAFRQELFAARRELRQARVELDRLNAIKTAREAERDIDALLN
jgi:hypothetical protein